MDVIWCQGVQSIDYPTINSSHTIVHRTDHNARPSQTDKHHGNSATIRPNERIAR